MRRGLTLLEVLVAVAVLSVVVALLATARIEAVRAERAQREHALLSELMRSEAELLRLGAADAGACSVLEPELVEAGFACEVVATCGFEATVCSDRGSLYAYVVRASAPSGASAELSLLFGADPGAWIVTQR